MTRALQRWRGSASATPNLELGDVRRRMELVLAALYGRDIPIAAAGRAAPPRTMRRFRGQAGRIFELGPLPESDGQEVRLPPALGITTGKADTVSLYRLLAIEQAERVIRGTGAHVPDDKQPLLRDLYLLFEGAAIDAAIARKWPGSTTALAAARAESLAMRRPMHALSSIERRVELLARETLAADVRHLNALQPSPSPADSLARAHAQLVRLRADRSTYRGLDPIALWGIVRPSALTEPNFHYSGSPLAMRMDSRTKGQNRRGPSRTDQSTDPGESPRRQPPSGSPRSDERGTAPFQSAHGERGDAAPDPTTQEAAGLPLAGAYYPEWDHVARRYRPAAVVVRHYEPRLASADWSADMLRRHAPLARQVRQQFERLQSQRARLHRQKEGDAIDLDAYVESLAEQRSGHPPHDRLYESVRQTRSSLAIALLLDTSGSTDAAVTSELQIIDVERIAALLAMEAFEALGDLYAVLAFGGKGATDVRVSTLKDFREPGLSDAHRRISALVPEGFTRLGAAVRHTTALLARQPAGHRLLLLLSDGRPHDLGEYQGDYAVEDARQSIVEARASGVYPFCLTVDREAQDYVPRIFGPTGHTVLLQPLHLPKALVGVVRHLIRG